MSRLMPLLWGAPSSGWFVTAADQATTQGLDYTGLAALIASFAGMVSAVGGLVIGLRNKAASQEDLKSDVLMELLVKALEDERDRDEPERRSGSRP